jgi:hypothetical protein
MPTCIPRTPREAIRRQIINVVGSAFATGVFLMQAAVNWVRGERFLTALLLLSIAWLVFGIIVVSRRILKAVGIEGIRPALDPTSLKGGSDGAL